jgi:hypothetical protein
MRKSDNGNFMENTSAFLYHLLFWIMHTFITPGLCIINACIQTYYNVYRLPKLGQKIDSPKRCLDRTRVWHDTHGRSKHQSLSSMPSKLDINSLGSTLASWHQAPSAPCVEPSITTPMTVASLYTRETSTFFYKEHILISEIPITPSLCNNALP